MTTYGNLEKLAYQRQLIGAGIGAVTGGGAGYLGSSRDADEDEGRFRSRRLRNTLIGSALGGALGGGIGHMTRAKPAARTPAPQVIATAAPAPSPRPEQVAAPQPALIGVDAGHVTPQVIATETTHAPRAPVSAAPITEQPARAEDAVRRLRERLESLGGAQGDLAADATLRGLSEMIKRHPNPSLTPAEAAVLHEALDAEAMMRDKEMFLRQQFRERRVMEDRVRHAPTPEVIATNVPHVAAQPITSGGQTGAATTLAELEERARQLGGRPAQPSPALQQLLAARERAQTGYPDLDV